MKAILKERRKQLSEWTTVVSTVQWGSYTTWRLSLRMLPLTVMTRRVPRTVFAVLSGEGDEAGVIKEIREKLVEYVQGVVEVQESRQREVSARKNQTRRRSRETRS